MAKNEINFTKAAIEKLPIPEKGKRVEFYDTKNNHLLIRVSSSGLKTFQLYRWFNGSPERVTIGRYPEISVEQARKEALKLDAQYAMGDSPADKKKRMREEMTFAELFRVYMERHASIAKKTWKDDLRCYEQYLARTLGKKKLSKVARKDIAAIHTHIGKDHQTQANRVLALISSVFGKAIEYGLWENLNPCQGIKKFSEKSRDRFLGKGELPRFFQALQEEPNDTVRDYFLVSLLTGARRSNVLAMRWNEIDFDEATWRIPETKNGEPQTVTLGNEVLEILRQRRKGTRSFFVFPGSGRTGHLIEPKKGWKRLLTRAGLNDLKIHDLRRTMGSWQAKTGASLAIIGKSLNHKSQSTTAIYARLDIDPVRESMEKATAAMLEAARQGKNR